MGSTSLGTPRSTIMAMNPDRFLFFVEANTSVSRLAATLNVIRALSELDSFITITSSG